MINTLTAETFLKSLIGLLLLGIVGFGGFAYYAFDQSQQRTVESMRMGRDLAAAAAAARAADAAVGAPAVQEPGQTPVRAAKRAMAPQPTQAYKQQQEAIRKHLAEARTLLERYGLDASAVAAADRLQAKMQQAASRRAAATAGTAAPVLEKWVPVAPAVESLIDQESGRLAQEASTEKRRAAWLMAFLVALGVLIALRFRDWIRKANGRPLRTATQLIERVAAGDLTVRAEGMDQLHTRKLAEALNGMTVGLRALASEVMIGSRMVADTSAQIAQGNLDLSQRTEEQASTLEETASSMEELTSTVAQNADSARQASQLAATASDTARKGGEVVDSVVNTMDEILDASKKMAEIISVIDGIAFQTNILALNAAVEAARAGEQGRGFAVVAAEVRSLAHRTTAAAKEIKTLIVHSEQKVQAGSARVDEAGHTMVSIVLSFKKVNDLIAEIAAASQEQSAGIGQVNTAVAQMEQVVQQNASLVEEATAATEAMKEQAAALLQAVSRFKLEEEQAESLEPPVLPAESRPVADRPFSPVQIKVKPGIAAPLVFAAAGSRKPSANGNGQWEEF